MLIEKIPSLFGQGFPKKASPIFKLNQYGSGETVNKNIEQRSQNEEDFVSLSFNSRELSGGIKHLAPKIDFDFDFKAGDFVIKVLDKESGDIIRQIPSEEFQRMAKQIGEFQEKFLDSET